MAMPEPIENPYAAPRSLLDTPQAVGSGASPRWHLAWDVVFAVNLIVPLLFAAALMTRGAGWVGVALGTALMLLLGHLGCSRSRQVAFDLMAGGVCVGLSQVMPILQMIVGSISQALTSMILRQLPPEDRHAISTVHEGFLMTVLTGGQLMLVALVCGQVIFLIRRAWKARSA